jgi:DNA-binding NarL/FixJ family response regulator
MKKPKVIIVDDHDMFRDGIKSMLILDEVAEVIAEASNGKQFLELLENHTPDLVLMDIDMPLMDGIEATRAAVTKNPELKVLVLTMFGEEKYYVEMIEAGAKGFVLKSSNKSELIKAILDVANGQSYFSNELLSKIIAKIGTYSPANKKKEALSFSDREIEIIQLMCTGISTNEIADKMCLSNKTVENYRVKLLNKTGCKNSVSLVVYAIKNGIIEI